MTRRSFSWLAFPVLLAAVACSSNETSDDDDGSAGSGTGTPSCDDSVDYQSDPHHCGSCGHDCLGGACAQSVCQPVVLSTEGYEPRSVEVDATHV